MTVNEVLEAIETLRKQGNSDLDIARSFYLMYIDDKIDKNQCEALLAVLGYALPNGFWEMNEDEQVKYFMDK